MRAEDVVELIAEIRGMADLERMTVFHSPTSLGVDQNTTPEPMIVLAGYGLRFGGAPRQHPHELIEPLGLEVIGGRQLPEEWTGLPAESQHAAGEEVSQGMLTVAKLQIVSDETATFDGEDKAAVGHRFGPTRKDAR